MTDEEIRILQDPATKGWLRRVRKAGENFLATEDGSCYVIRGNIVCFLQHNQLTGNNAGSEKMYDKMAEFYNFANWLYARVKHTRDGEQIHTWLDALGVQDGNRVLEVCGKTGRNLERLNPRATYVDADLSLEMLRQCSRAMRRMRRQVTFLYAEPETLPLQDGVFDVVYSVGAFNAANNKTRLAQEMLRVARSGATITICDERERFYIAEGEEPPQSDNPFALEPPYTPSHYLPPECTDVQYEESAIARLFRLTFRKP